MGSQGEWIAVPKHDFVSGGEPKNYRIARREKYFDKKGQIQEAMAYGTEKRDQLVWYNLNEMLAALPKWVIPTISRYQWENTENWYNGLYRRMDQERASQRGANRGSRGSDRGRGRASGGSSRSESIYDETREENSGIGRGRAIGTYRRDQSYERNRYERNSSNRSDRRYRDDESYERNDRQDRREVGNDRNDRGDYSRN